MTKGSVRARLGVLLAVLASLAVFVPVDSADARPGGNNSTNCAPGGLMCITVSANDGSVCSNITGGVQCTPALVITGVPAQVVSTGGHASWGGSVSCEWRKKGDGFNPNWGPWTSCSISGSGPTSSSWGALQNPRGGSRQWSGQSIVNLETPGLQDCVEIRTSISASANAGTSGVTLASASTRWPSSGTSVSGVCEGQSPY